MTALEPVWVERETRPVGWWGMLLGVATEATLVLGLVATYFYLRFKTTPWPPDGIPKPPLLLPCVLAGLLVAAGAPMLVAEHARRAGRTALLRACLFAAFVLTGAFVGLQFLQWHDDWGSVHPQRDAYASLYYTLPATLWAHAAVGVLLLGFVQYQAWRSDYRAVRGAAVQVAALYVYFLSLVAPLVLFTVYLSPRL
jgi:heme/copper-type cytochrome/quinol oxidase subunit 3